MGGTKEEFLPLYSDNIQLGFDFLRNREIVRYDAFPREINCFELYEGPQLVVASLL